MTSQASDLIQIADLSSYEAQTITSYLDGCGSLGIDGRRGGEAIGFFLSCKLPLVSFASSSDAAKSSTSTLTRKQVNQLVAAIERMPADGKRDFALNKLALALPSVHEGPAQLRRAMVAAPVLGKARVFRNGKAAGVLIFDAATREVRLWEKAGAPPADLAPLRGNDISDLHATMEDTGTLVGPFAPKFESLVMIEGVPSAEDIATTAQALSELGTITPLLGSLLVPSFIVQTTNRAATEMKLQVDEDGTRWFNDAPIAYVVE